MSGGRRGHVLVIAGVLAAIVAVVWLSAPGSGRRERQTSRPSISTFATVPGQSATPLTERPPAWRAPDTSDSGDAARAFATAIWTYDTRVAGLDDWRIAVGTFVDPDGPPESGEVARAMLPLWQQWENLARQEARAQVTDVRVSQPPELVSLERDPRAPQGWHAVVVRAQQEVVAGGRTSAAPRQVTVSVVCRPRCYVWSATPEVPR
jgi:hypothetical protein